MATMDVHSHVCIYTCTHVCVHVHGQEQLCTKCTTSHRNRAQKELVSDMNYISTSGSTTKVLPNITTSKKAGIKMAVLAEWTVVLYIHYWL